MHRYRQCIPVFLYAYFSQEGYTCFTEYLHKLLIINITSNKVIIIIIYVLNSVSID